MGNKTISGTGGYGQEVTSQVEGDPAPPCILELWQLGLHVLTGGHAPLPDLAVPAEGHEEEAVIGETEPVNVAVVRDAFLLIGSYFAAL